MYMLAVLIFNIYVTPGSVGYSPKVHWNGNIRKVGYYISQGVGGNRIVRHMLPPSALSTVQVC